MSAIEPIAAGDCPDIDVGAHEWCPVGTHLGDGQLDRNRSGCSV